MSASPVGATVGARIASLSIEEAATIRRNPNSTILPPDAKADSRAEGAFVLLEDLRTGRRESLTVMRTLGEGGMGVVHLAEQASMGRGVAVKTLKAGHRDPASVQRLLREAWITGTLEHPNIVPVYDVALDASGAPQVVLKRIEGVDWASLLADRKELDKRAEGNVEEWNIRTLMQVCNAVHFAHSHSVIHRDLKPENVMIGKFGEVYVVDWGIAVSLRDDANPRLPRASAARDLAGTPIYMAPEMLLGDPTRLGERTDVYLLGAILFEVTTGRPPHDGPNLEAIFGHILTSPLEMPASMPGEIAEICRRAMAPDPNDRYASAEDFRKALSDYLEHRESMHLARRAQRRLTELMEEIREARSGESDRASVEHLFGECRFGFRAALDTWAENEVALGGLRLAIKSMADYEIGEGNIRAARALVNELSDAPEDLRRKLAELERTVAEHAARHEQLEAFGREHDPTIGSRTRTFVAIVMGAIWTTAPAVTHFVLRARNLKPKPEIAVYTVGGSFIVLCALGYWARETLMKTALNRRIGALTGFTLLSQGVLVAALALAHVDPVMSVAMSFFLWFTVLSVASVTLEAGLWPAAVTYGVGLFAALLHPDVVLLIMSASHCALTVNVVSVWRKMFSGFKPS
jgi:serine/threonine-protein kinase